DLRDELAKARPARARGARAAGVLVDDGDGLPQPAELDRPLHQRVLARLRLDVALHLDERRLAHVDNRPPTPVLLRDLRPLTHPAPPPKAAPAGARAPASPPAGAPPAASPTPPPARLPPRAARGRAVPTSSPPFTPQAEPRRGQRSASTASRPARSRQ